MFDILTAIIPFLRLSFPLGSWWAYLTSWYSSKWLFKQPYLIKINKYPPLFSSENKPSRSGFATIIPHSFTIVLNQPCILILSIYLFDPIANLFYFSQRLSNIILWIFFTISSVATGYLIWAVVVFVLVSRLNSATQNFIWHFSIYGGRTCQWKVIVSKTL